MTRCTHLCHDISLYKKTTFIVCHLVYMVKETNYKILLLCQKYKLFCRGTSINISCKLGLREGREKFLHRVTSLKSGIETYNDGRYINVCRMKVYQSKSNFEKIRNYLTSQECVSSHRNNYEPLFVRVLRECQYNMGNQNLS